MTTPTSGQISLDDVKNEFGRAAPDGDTSGTAISLGKYRVNDAATFNKPLDVGVPQSGTIKLSDLRDKTRNVIFRYGGEFRRDLDAHKPALNIKKVYDGNQDNFNNVSATTSDPNNLASLSQPLRIGQFSDRPADTSDSSKPIILTVQVAGILGSEGTTLDNPNDEFVALDTGDVGAGVSLRIEVTSTGKIFGAGGRGGNGSDGSGVGGPATDGTSAIGVRSGIKSVDLINAGYIQCGFGGGGGGGGTGDDPSKSFTDPYISGGGGGGGAGFPNGQGGDAGKNAIDGSNGNAGGNSSNTTGGGGGDGGSPSEGSSSAGDGGDGGENGIAPGKGDKGTGGDQVTGGGSDGGNAGANGSAIRLRTGASATFNTQNIGSGSVVGSTDIGDYEEN